MKILPGIKGTKFKMKIDKDWQGVSESSAYDYYISCVKTYADRDVPIFSTTLHPLTSQLSKHLKELAL